MSTNNNTCAPCGGQCITKLDWLLDECVRTAMDDGVLSASFYQTAREVWHHVTHEKPMTGGAPETNELHLDIKQFALGFGRSLGPAREDMRQLRPPMYPDGATINRKIAEHKSNV